MVLALTFKPEYVFDIVLVLGIMIWAFADGKKGFINCFFSFITAIACTLAVMFLSGPILRMTGGLFGLEGSIQKGLGGWLSGIPMGNLDVSVDGWRTKLDALSLPQFMKDAVLEEIEGVVGGVPAGTLLGVYLGDVIGSFLSLVICSVFVFIGTKLLMGLLKGVLNRIARASKLVSKVNVLGGIVAGMFKAFALVCIVLAVLAVIPSESVSALFNNTMLLKSLYNNNPIMLVFSWFTNV